MANIVTEAFKSCYNDIEEHQNHNYNRYILQEIPEKNKFQQSWIFDPKLPKCEKTGIWCLTYIEGKGMLRGLCRMANTLKSNNSKVWNSEASTQFRTQAVRAGTC